MSLIEGNIMKFHTEIKEKNEELLLLISDQKTKKKMKNNVYKKVKLMEIEN